ncbi:LiaF transmembrane domain-containing protein [Bacteroides sp.]
MKKNQLSSRKGMSGKLLVAALFIAAGVLLLARNVGWISATLFSTLVSWQMLLVVLGIYMMVKRVFIRGLILFAIGAYFLSPHVGWLPVNINSILLPVILVAIGVAFIFKPRRQRAWGNHQEKEFMNTQYESADGILRSENTFSGVRQVVLDEVFRGGTIQNMFGGTAIDLRRTTIPEGETYIDIECTFGGIEIYVPSSWKIVFRCKSCLGGCEDKRFGDSVIDQSRVLVIRGDITFGGLEIKS